jgi:aminoglycoside phosphotransferase (APT) family kinase protein
MSDPQQLTDAEPMTDAEPLAVPGPVPAAVLDWAAAVLGGPAVRVLRGLRDGGSPWLIQARDRRAVLRTGPPGSQRQIATEAAGLAVAARTGVPAPALLGHDDGTAAGGVPVLLSSWLPGSSLIPLRPDPARLRALGAAAARLHAVPLAPAGALPLRHHPIGDEDFAALRAGHDVGPVQRAAQDALDRARPAEQPPVFVHGDLWQGNALFDGSALTGLVDWDAAGAGAPGIDLGSLRMDAAFCYGAGAEAEISAGWSAAAGRPVPDEAYWDIVAALSTPPGLGWFPAAIAAQGGRPDLTADLLRARHEEFIRQALARLR